MSAPSHVVTTVYIDAGAILCVAFRRTVFQRYQSLRQRVRQLTGTAFPQTSTATAGESRVDTRGTLMLPRLSLSVKSFEFQAACDPVCHNGRFCRADGAKTSTRCWTITRRECARVDLDHREWSHPTPYEAWDLQQTCVPTFTMEAPYEDVTDHLPRPAQRLGTPEPLHLSANTAFVLPWTPGEDELRKNARAGLHLRSTQQLCI